MSDSTEFRQYYDQHADEILAFLAARSANRSDAEDLAQETWLRVSRHLSSFDGRNFRAWLFKIARNVWNDRQRILLRKPVQELGDHDPADGRDNELAVYADRVAALRACIDELAKTDPDRAAVVRYRAEGCDYDRIAEKLNVPLKTAMTRFHRAKEQLSHCLQGKLA
jgi:RNA polymerase sigma-70 factor (ECF subfamily)